MYSFAYSPPERFRQRPKTHAAPLYHGRLPGNCGAGVGQIPDLAVTTDVIVGFPGETDAEFEETLRFVEEIGFSRLHFFAILPPGTHARFPNQIPTSAKREQSERSSASRRARRKFPQEISGTGT